MSTSWWHEVKSQGISKITRIWLWFWESWMSVQNFVPINVLSTCWTWHLANLTDICTTSQLQHQKHLPPTTLHAVQSVINMPSLLNILQYVEVERARKTWRHWWVQVLSRPSSCAPVTHHCLWYHEFSSQSLKLARASIISHRLNRLMSETWHRWSVSSRLSVPPHSTITHTQRLVTEDRASTHGAEKYCCRTHKQTLA